MSKTNWLEEATKRCEVATQGPWFVSQQPWHPGADVPPYILAKDPDPHRGEIILDGVTIDEWPAEQGEPDYGQQWIDQEFVADGRTDLPFALARLDAVRSWLESELAQHVQEGFTCECNTCEFGRAMLNALDAGPR